MILMTIKKMMPRVIRIKMVKKMVMVALKVAMLKMFEMTEDNGCVAVSVMK